MEVGQNQASVSVEFLLEVSLSTNFSCGIEVVYLWITVSTSGTWKVFCILKNDSWWDHKGPYLPGTMFSSSQSTIRIHQIPRRTESSRIIQISDST